MLAKPIGAVVAVTTAWLITWGGNAHAEILITTATISQGELVIVGRVRRLRETGVEIKISPSKTVQLKTTSTGGFRWIGQSESDSSHSGGERESGHRPVLELLGSPTAGPPVPAGGGPMGGGESGGSGEAASRRSEQPPRANRGLLLPCSDRLIDGRRSAVGSGTPVRLSGLRPSRRRGQARLDSETVTRQRFRSTKARDSAKRTHPSWMLVVAFVHQHFTVLADTFRVRASP